MPPGESGRLIFPTCEAYCLPGAAPEEPEQGEHDHDDQDDPENAHEDPPSAVGRSLVVQRASVGTGYGSLLVSLVPAIALVVACPVRGRSEHDLPRLYVRRGCGREDSNLHGPEPNGT